MSITLTSLHHRLTVVWEHLKTSLWFVPALMCAAAIGLSFAALQIDANFPDKPWWLNRGNGEQATTFLSSLLSSMITMTTLVLSITMVVLTLAASALGPRLLRSFMGDLRTQAILGAYVGTIVYVFILLRSIDSTADRTAVPHLAISIGTALSLGCVCLLLFFVHHLARSVISDVVVQRVGNNLDGTILRLTTDSGEDSTDKLDSGWLDDEAAAVAIDKGGYIQSINVEALVDLARHSNAKIRLPFRPGQHLVPGGDVMFVSPASAASSEFMRDARDAVLVGPEASATHDIEFAVRQLVEIALRALSPGINDPFTAIAVIDRMSLSLCIMLKRDEIPFQHVDEDDTIRLIAPMPRFGDVLGTAFNQIRRAGTDKVDILIRMLDALSSLFPCSRRRSDSASLGLHARLIVQAARCGVKNPDDLAAVETKFSAIEDKLLGGLVIPSFKSLGSC